MRREKSISKLSTLMCSMFCVSPSYRHCEIGKVDIFANRNLKMAVFRKNVAFRAVDIDRLMLDDPELANSLTEQCLELLQREKVPALPVTVFSYEDYQSALQYMMNGQHTGKLVLVPPRQGDTLEVVDCRPLFASNSDGQPQTVMLSGCLGGFGLRIVAYVVAMGAKHIMLLDRDEKRRRSVEWVRQHSYIDYLQTAEEVQIEIVHADVSKMSDVVDAFAAVDRLGLPEVGSIFHLAGVLDDKLIDGIDRTSFAKVYAPKADGAWNLHVASQRFTRLDHFVLLSSTSSVFGNPGQTNYAAANSFQDGLAALRKQQDLPGLSFCMGAVSDAGMAARNPQLLQMMKANGLPALSSIAALEGLDSALRSGKHSNLVTCLASDLAADMGSSDFLRTAAQLVTNSAAFKLTYGSSLSKEAVVEMISLKIAALCGVEKVDACEPFSSYGLNSISVAELGAFLKNDLSYPVSAMELMTSASCDTIADGFITAQGGNAMIGADKDTTASGKKERAGSASSFQVSKNRKPSRFSPSREEHFSKRVDAEVVQNLKNLPPKSRKKHGKSELKMTSAKSSYSPTIKCTPVDGLLPPPCFEALNELKNFARSIQVSKLLPPKPVNRIRNVIVTGVTGFVGRHFVVKLLEGTDVKISKVYCPIRASDDNQALKRLVDALEEAGKWKESYRPRLVAFSANLEHKCLGVSQELHEELASVDAVYHFAASLNLAANFEKMRKANCIPLKEVFRLCLTGQRKHLFLASTLGVFPQYFCQFGNELADKAIGRDVMPDIDLMKRILPLGIAGYAWSKLIMELAALELAKDIPLAIFRLPVMFTDSSTGFTVAQDPYIRLFLAVLQTRMAPGHSRPFALEDADVCNTMMLRVSLNPDRRNVLYHCSSQSLYLPTECSPFQMLGFNCQPSSYADFKAACLKLGDESPLHTYWGLLDHFAPYWIDCYGYAKKYPIDISTVEEDCHPLPDKSNSLQALSSSMKWVLQNPESWPFDADLLEATIDVDLVLAPARALCETYALDFQTVVPPLVHEGLRRICDEIDAPTPMLSTIQFNLTSKLESRVHLHHLLKMHPEIKDEPIDAPLFIVGLNRTGTTFLHRTLDASGCFEAPRLEDQYILPPAEEMAYPKPDAVQHRLFAIQSLLDEVRTRAQGIHDIGIGLAEEDMCAHSCSFTSLEYDILYNLPKYRQWLDAQPLYEVYQFHRSWMQALSWLRRRQQVSSSTSQLPTQLRWCFKLPWHARSLPALFQAYPDAVLVHTHRAPEQVAGSWCSLVEQQRERFVHNLDKKELGQEQVMVLRGTLSAAMDFRAQHREYDNRWLDVQFDDLVASPVNVAKQVISHAGIQVNKQIVNRMAESVKESKRKRSKVKLHQYNLSDYGISPDDFKGGIFAESPEKATCSSFLCCFRWR
jgi:thioester reductase-like protein